MNYSALEIVAMRKEAGLAEFFRRPTSISELRMLGVKELADKQRAAGKNLDTNTVRGVPLLRPPAPNPELQAGIPAAARAAKAKSLETTAQVGKAVSAFQQLQANQPKPPSPPPMQLTGNTPEERIRSATTRMMPMDENMRKMLSGIEQSRARSTAMNKTTEIQTTPQPRLKYLPMVDGIGRAPAPFKNAQYLALAVLNGRVAA